MTLPCDVPAPRSLGDLLATVDRCAVAAGGPDWPSLALLGLVTVVVALGAFALPVVVWGHRR